MTTLTMVILALIAVVVAGLVVWWYLQQRRRERLQVGFGPEYERTVREVGDRRRAEAELARRQQRVERLHIRPLAPAERARFADLWRGVQARFVDDPAGTIGEADRLVGDVMATRGYPLGDFAQRAADISVAHATVVTHYRAAHAIAHAQERGEATTEDLRQALVHYRALFEDLLETQPTAPSDGAGQPSSRAHTRTEAER
jgi:hypothetical protein